MSLLLLASASCAEPEFPVLDLAADLILAEFHHDTGVIDLGGPEARQWLMDGWSWGDEKWLDGAISFVWGTNERSRAPMGASSS